MNSSLRTSLLAGLLALSVVILALGLWRQSSKREQIREAIEQLTPQKQAVEQRPILQQTASAQPEVSPEKQAVEQPPVVSVGTAQVEVRTEQSRQTKKLVPTPTGYAPEPRAGGLVLAGTHAAPTASGFSATMQFSPNITEPLGIIAVVVRLPKDSPCRILDLAVTGTTELSAVTKRVADDGKFAVFQGQAATAEAVEVALSVSDAVVADVRGTCGIGPLDLNIGPSGASANPK